MHCLGAGVGGQSSPNGSGAPGSLLNVVRALGVLVSEGRIQGGPRGYKEGPHCVAPLQAAPNNHVCKKDNYLCDRYLVLVREISERLECGTYLCVEVVLCSDCPCGLIKSKNEHRVLSSSSLVAPWQQSSEMLLEYWCICVVASKNQETMNSQGLYQAVRSRLHFSQVAAWWSRTKGLNPSYVATRIVQQPINGEDHLRRFRETPVEHTFPLAGVGDGNSLKVTMWALPRMDETPVLKCPAHPELTATSQAASAQTGTSELQAEGMESGATQTQSSCPRAATPTKLLIPTDNDGCNGENSAASPGEPGGVIDGLLVAEPGPASSATSSEPGQQHLGNGMSSSAPNNSLAGGGEAKFVYYMSSFRSTAQLNECNQPGKHNCPCAAATAEEDDETTSSAPPRVERKRRRSLPCGPPPASSSSASYSAPPPSLNNSPPERTSLEQHLPALREANPHQSLGPAGVDSLDSLDNLESSFRIQLSIDEHQQKQHQQQQQQQCSAKHLEKRLKRSYSEEHAPASSVAASSHAPCCPEPKVPSSTRSPTADKGATRVTNLRLNPLLHPEAADACQKQSAGILDWISSRVPRNSGSSKQTSIVGRCESSSASGRRNCNLDLSPREFDEVLAVLRARTPLGRRRTGLRTAKRRDKYDRLVNEQTHSSQPQSPTATQRQQTLQPPPQRQPQQQQSCNKAEVLLGAILRSSSKETVEPIDPSQSSVSVSDVSTVINKRFFQLKHLFTRNEQQQQQQQLPQHPQLAACEHRAKRRIDFSDSTEDEEDEDERNDEAAQEKPSQEQESKSKAKLKAELPLVSVSLDVDNANATFEDEVDKGSVPSMKDQERFRRSLENAASMVFHSRTGLPLTSSPAPLRRGSCCFDFDSSLNSVSSKRSALFDLNTPPSPGAVSLEDNDKEVENICDISGEVRRGRSTSGTRPQSHALLGSFEESALNGRLEPVSTVHGFTAEIGASGSFCPKHRKLPVTVFFYTLGDIEKVSSPYLAHINLGKKGYQVPRSGTIQVTLSNPLGTVVKMFVVLYDLSDMPPRSHTFLRQRTLRDKTLRYLIHLRFMSGKSGRIYLHTDVRMIICRKSDVDTASDFGSEPPKELRSYIHGPTNPKFSPRC
ncbi:hypothetical protein TKK_0019537 [Trichogramma kaykai]